MSDSGGVAPAALGAARPALARLDPTRHPEENAADLVETWSAIESALRAALGGAALSGQALVRETRQRELITLDQTHALLDFLAVRERVQDASYQPTASDIASARHAVAMLAGAEPDPPAVPTLIVTPQPAPPAPAAASPFAPPSRRGPGRLIVGLVVVLALAGAGYYWYSTHARSSALAAGIVAHDSGRTDVARTDFEQAARDEPASALPHIYLARLARENGDFPTAARELTTAVGLEPDNPLAQRELGALFLARGSRYAAQHRADLAAQDYDAARRAYVRVLQVAPSDTTAQGFLGCALARLGRTAEAASWLGRAGQGPWSACAIAPSGQMTQPTP